MLVLVATRDGQGAVDGDYCWAVEGELVTPVVAECASGARCGCSRGFPGLASGKATTTAVVVDLPLLTKADLRNAVADSLERGGWVDLLPPDEADEVIGEIIDEHVECIEEVSAAFGAGSIIGRSGPRVFERSVAEAA